MRRKVDLLNQLFASVKNEADNRRKKGLPVDKIAALQGMMMPHQAALEADPNPFVAVVSSRQTGKSTAALLLATIRCLVQPRSSWVIIGLTRPAVKKVYWSDLQNISTTLELGIKFQYQELVASFPNSSKIYFVGTEDIGEAEKLRGGRYHGAIIDECKSYPEEVLRYLVEEVLAPALMGQAGQLYLIGTPGDILRGEFYEATCDQPVLRGEGDGALWSNWRFRHDKLDIRPFVWSSHRWSLQNNTIQFKDVRTGKAFTLWEKALQIKALRGWKDDHPAWRREFLGEWVEALGKFVYRLRKENLYTPNALGLPAAAPEGTVWYKVAGLDFGSTDGTAVVVWAYSPTFPGLWEVYSEKRRTEGTLRLTVSSIAQWFHQVEAAYGPIDGWVGDMSGLATMVVDTLGDDHQVFIEPAEKREKIDHIELFNNDLDAGIIHCVEDSELTKEMPLNRWLPRSLATPKRVEDPATPNDLCDAGLYAFRWAAHRRAKPSETPLKAFSEAWWFKKEEAERAELIESIRQDRDDSARLDQPHDAYGF